MDEQQRAGPRPGRDTAQQRAVVAHMLEHFNGDNAVEAALRIELVMSQVTTSRLVMPRHAASSSM